MNITSTKQQKTVHYKKPLLERRTIGSKPRHSFDRTPTPKESYVALPDPHQGGDQKVWASQPVRAEDGQVRFKEVATEIDLTPRSPLARGLGWGVLGAIPGAFGGALVGDSMLAMANGALRGGLVGAAVVGGIAGAVGAYSVLGEKTELVWDSHKVYEHEMKGYHELVGLGEKNGEKGYFHRFMPDVESSVVGEYKTPRVIRYKGEKPGEEPELVSKMWPDTLLKKEPEVPNRQVDVSVSYEKGALRSKYMGRMPSDYWDYSSWSDGYTECGPDGCNTGGQRVYRHTPIYEPNSEPRVEAVNERLQEKASSVSGTAISYGLLGGLGGLGLGALASVVSPSLPMGATLGALGAIGTAAGAYYGATQAADDRVRVEWREVSINEKEMVGYSEHTRRRYVTRCRREYDHWDEKWETKCRQEPEGWHHDFYARVREWPVGSYVKPIIVHYSAKEEGEAS